MNFAQFIFSVLLRGRKIFIFSERTLRVVARDAAANFIRAGITPTARQRDSMIDRPVLEVVNAVSAIMADAALIEKRKRLCLRVSLAPFLFRHRFKHFAAARCFDRLMPSNAGTRLLKDRDHGWGHTQPIDNGMPAIIDQEGGSELENVSQFAPFTALDHLLDFAFGRQNLIRIERRLYFVPVIHLSFIVRACFELLPKNSLTLLKARRILAVKSNHMAPTMVKVTNVNFDAEISGDNEEEARRVEQFMHDHKKEISDAMALAAMKYVSESLGRRAWYAGTMEAN